MNFVPFIILLTAYTRVHQFEPNYTNQSGTAAKWVCRNDATKFATFSGNFVTFEAKGDTREIMIFGKSIIGFDSYLEYPYGQYGHLTIFEDFGDQFENWFANVFDWMDCDPDSHINLAERLDMEKTFTFLSFKVFDALWADRVSGFCED